MTAHKVYYLTCDQCGKIYANNGFTEYGEESQCIKDMAIDDGWVCDVEVGSGSLLDFCSQNCCPQITNKL